MNTQEMKERKKELGYTDAQISALTGVPVNTIQKFFSGVTPSPDYETLAALEQLLSSKKPWDPLIGESFASYSSTRHQGEYTLEDYYNLPDDCRAELIDGVFYDMAPPSCPHQLIAGFFFNQLFNHITTKKGKCLPMISPVGVQLDCDDKTMVEPDVIIICDRNKVIRRCVCGAPDFILEVLSPSTRRKDLSIKLYKYMNAGVREYWLIDPMKKKVMVYHLEQDEFPSIYGFDARIPVAVLGNECQIDFQEMNDYISFLDEA